jgi:hypothetical protein
LQRGDYFRYWVTYNFGGLYLDADTICVRSIFDMAELGHGINIATEIGYYYLAQGIYFVDKLDNSIMHQMLLEFENTVDKLDFTDPNMPEISKSYPFAYFGPHMITRYFEKYPKEFTILPTHYFYRWYNCAVEYLYEINVGLDDVYIAHWWGSNREKFRDLVTNVNWLKNSISIVALAIRRILADDPYLWGG